MKTLGEIRNFFQADKFATEMGAEIEAAQPGFCRVSFTAGPQHMNAGGFVQGGALFTLADFAFAVAANTGSGLTLSLSNQITYLKPCQGGRITAEAREVSSGRSTCYYSVSVFSEDGRRLAEMTVNGYRRKNTDQ